MKTLILEKPGSFQLTDTPPPAEPGSGEALVRVHRVGICGTDLHAFRGRQPFFSYPRILGHELGVEVVALGPDTAGLGLAIGDRCAVEPYLNCGHCGPCRRGKTNCCANLQVLGVHIDGGMRETIIVPATKLHKSETLSLDHLAIVETLCIGAHAVGRGQPAAGEGVLVIGTGPIGLGVAQFAKLSGARVVLMEISDSRMAFAKETLGLTEGVDAKTDPAPQLEAIFGGELPTLVFDATGNPQSMMNAFNLVASGGKLVFVGLFQGEVTFNDPEFHRREMTLLSSRNATAADFKQVIAALESGQVKLDPWITHHAGPEALPQTFPTWLEPQTGVVKAMLDF